MSIADISDGVGRSRGEIFRMLQVLEERDYISRGEGDTGYAITPRLFRLGMEQPPVKSAVETALPVMHRLAEEVDQSCHLVVPSGDQIVVIARVDPPGDIGLVVRIGHRRPMAGSASGHVLLAWQEAPVRERWLSVIEHADHALDRRKLMKSIQQIQAQGHASHPSREVDGVTDISAPVMEHGRAVCALTVPFIERRTRSGSIDVALKHLKQATADISHALIYGIAGKE